MTAPPRSEPPPAETPRAAPASLSTRIRRWLTRVVLLSGMAALAGAVGFFMLRDGFPDLALFMGRIVWGGLMVCIGGGVLLAAAGAVQALFGPLPDEAGEGEAPPG
jgi:hypothetical protein